MGPERQKKESSLRIRQPYSILSLTHFFSPPISSPHPAGRDWRKRVRGTLDDPLGGYALTLVDSLDMLAVMGDYKA